ncbi:MAG: F0F1 ATP synthase subunit epsilon [Minwuiales bacterium]|nr:F0F1 ATP synthase subunit epsilon [Minwuiales bacterium]
MADKVAFELVSPERLLLSADVDMVVLPGSEGDFGVLPGHAPVVSTLRPGALEIYEGDQISERYFVNGGFAEVAGARLTVLAEQSIALGDLDRADLEQQIQNAREDVADAKDDQARDKAQERLDQLSEILATL